VFDEWYEERKKEGRGGKEREREGEERERDT